jgi:hypothetical protein
LGLLLKINRKVYAIPWAHPSIFYVSVEIIQRYQKKWRVRPSAISFFYHPTGKTQKKDIAIVLCANLVSQIIGC